MDSLAQPGELAPNVPAQLAPPNALEVLAELELMRRKVALLERRVSTWEADLNDVRTQIAELDQARQPEAPAFQQRLAEVSHRVGRLERRRATVAPPADDTNVTLRPSTPSRQSYAHLIGDGVVLVSAKWRPDVINLGEVVTLSAHVDGLGADDSVTFVVRSLVEETPLVTLEARVEGDEVVAQWKVPDDLGYREVFFEARCGEAAARSPVLVLPVGE